MSPVWTDVVARARGLHTHLLSREALVELAGAEDVPALAAMLQRLGRIPAGVETARQLELALRRGHAQWLSIIARWCGPRAERLAVVFLGEDLRTVRRLLRATASSARGAAPLDPLAGSVATPSLSERDLAALAEQPSAAGIATALSAIGHPFAPALSETARDRGTDLFALDRALERAFVAAACAAARHGDAPLVRTTRRLVDVTNARVLMVLAQQPPASREPETFVAGGQHLSRQAFEAAVAAPTGDDVARHIVRAFGRSPLAEPFRASADQRATRLEVALLAVLVRLARADARRAPLSTAPILAWALALRLEAVDLAALVYGIELGTPRSTIVHSLVSS